MAFDGYGEQRYKTTAIKAEFWKCNVYHGDQDNKSRISLFYRREVTGAVSLELKECKNTMSLFIFLRKRIPLRVLHRKDRNRQ